MTDRIIKMADWSRYPGGRERKQCTNSAEEFRDDVLLPALAEPGVVTVDLDGLAGMPASFTEEVFGGAVRAMGPDVASRIRVVNGMSWHLENVAEFMADEVARQAAEKENAR